MSMDELVWSLGADGLDLGDLDALSSLEGDFWSADAQSADSIAVADLLATLPDPSTMFDGDDTAAVSTSEDGGSPTSKICTNAVLVRSSMASSTRAVERKQKNGLTSKQRILRLREQVARLTVELNEQRKVSSQRYLAANVIARQVAFPLGEATTDEPSLWKRLAMKQWAHRQLAEQRNRTLKDAVQVFGRRAEALRQQVEEARSDQVSLLRRLDSLSR